MKKKYLVVIIIFISIPFISNCSSFHTRSDRTNNREAIAQRHKALNNHGLQYGRSSLQENSQHSSNTRHIVVRGDTIYRLSLRYRVSANALMQHNNINNPSDLRVGQVLIIPSNSTQSEATTSHIPSIQNNHNSITFIYPVQGKILSRFGYRKRSRRSSRVSFHNGLDIKGKIGTPILAAASGIVIFSGWKRGYGKVVKIQHSGGFVTVYGHNKINLVHRGQRVNSGQIIAQVGLTGRTTGSHVHFEIILRKKAVNPELYLNRAIALNSGQQP